MSPIMKALLGVLAYKALKGGNGQAAAPGRIGHSVIVGSDLLINAGSDP
jgi:hypothetical protein